METNVLHLISYGMYVISSVSGGAFNGQIANALVQVSSQPPLLALSVNKKNLTHDYIKESSLFSVSILERETPLKLIGRFGFRSGRTEKKFEGVKYATLSSGCPVVIDSALGYLGAKVVNAVDCGGYTLFLGEVTEQKLLKNGEVLTYDHYHQKKSGTTPETAPTFIAGEGRPPSADATPRYRCTVCNYVYDPAAGDPEGGVSPGTPFEKIPSDWKCPICGVGKDKFERMEGVCEST